MLSIIWCIFAVGGPVVGQPGAQELKGGAGKRGATNPLPRRLRVCPPPWAERGAAQRSARNACRSARRPVRIPARAPRNALSAPRRNAQSATGSRLQFRAGPWGPPQKSAARARGKMAPRAGRALWSRAGASWGAARGLGRRRCENERRGRPHVAHRNPPHGHAIIGINCCANASSIVARPAIAQLVEHLTVDRCSNQMVPGSIPGGRIDAGLWRTRCPV